MHRHTLLSPHSMPGAHLRLGENSVNQTSKVSAAMEFSRQDRCWPSSTMCSFNKIGDKGMIRPPQSLGSKLLLFFKVQLRGSSNVTSSKRTFPCLWPRAGVSGAPQTLAGHPKPQTQPTVFAVALCVSLASL